jgi:predicted SnoaL-like aldol condensation-catalyzing enzyme
MVVSKKALRAEVEELYKDLKDQPPHTPEQIETIKLLIELHLVAFKYYDFERTRELVHPDYKQHSTMVATGQESIIDAAKRMRSWVEPQWKGPGEPHVIIEMKRVLVDGDFIVVQQRGKRYEDDRGQNVFDLYRVQNGRFCEHWDCQMEIPPESEMKHSNGVF